MDCIYIDINLLFEEKNKASDFTIRKELYSLIEFNDDDYSTPLPIKILVHEASEEKIILEGIF